jgi:cytochrome c-type biogenesis protein CcmE
VRLVIALSIASVLAVFLLYTSIAGGGTPSIGPAELGDRTETVSLHGRVVGPVSGDAHEGGLRFNLAALEDEEPHTVPVLYTGSVPDLFRVGREIVVDGRLEGGRFVAEPGSMVTKCPSKYSPARDGGSGESGA